MRKRRKSLVGYIRKNWELTKMDNGMIHHSSVCSNPKSPYYDYTIGVEVVKIKITLEEI